MRGFFYLGRNWLSGTCSWRCLQWEVFAPSYLCSCFQVPWGHLQAWSLWLEISKLWLCLQGGVDQPGPLSSPAQGSRGPQEGKQGDGFIWIFGPAALKTLHSPGALSGKGKVKQHDFCERAVAEDAINKETERHGSNLLPQVAFHSE